MTDYRKGKVVSASRFNYVGSPFNATAEVRDTYVNSNLNLARTFQASQRGGISESALSAFGSALHTLMDSLSPTHKGYQVWDPSNLLLVYRHHQGEKNISPQQLAEAVALAQKVFQSVFGSGQVSIGQAPTASQWSIVTSISDEPIGGLSSLAEFGGTVYIDGINLAGVFYR